MVTKSAVAGTLEQESSRERFEGLKSDLLRVSTSQRRILSALLKVQTTSDTGVEDESSVGPINAPMLYSAVSLTLEHAIPSYKAPPLSALRERAALHRAVEAFDRVIDQHTDVLQRARRMSYYMFCMRLVLGHMRDVGVPLAPRTLIQQCAHVAIVLDDAFPGYAAAGMLRMVFDRATRDQDRDTA